MAPKPITSPISLEWYPTLAFTLIFGGLVFAASFFIYATALPRRNRSLQKEITFAAGASFFLGFGSFFLLLASGVYV